MEGVLDAAVNEIDHHFNEVLQGTWLTGSRLAGGHAENQDKDQTQCDRPAEGIDVESPKAHFFCLFGGVGEAPVAR